MRLSCSSLVCALGLLAPLPSLANGPTGEESGADTDLSASAGFDAEPNADADADASPDATASPNPTPARTSKWNPRKDRPWIKRWAPEPHMLELGLYGGVFLLNGAHELFDPDVSLPQQGWQPMRRLNPDLGVRVGYYPLRFFGIEAEGGAMPSRIEGGGGSGEGVVPYTVRGHAVAQLGLWSVTPFALVGAGLLGLNSSGPLGSDIDPALHFGGGVKVYLNRWVMLRLDARDVVSHRRGVDRTLSAHNLEVLLGLSVTLNRKNEAREIIEDEPAPAAGPGDRDGDGILDTDDQCVDDPETPNGFEDEDGCPESDRDGDGFWDAQDACPDEAGVEPDGCPIRDTDGDGLMDDVDACVDEPETQNGFEDEDGCPDEVPEAVKRFNGAIKGITFDTNKATIRRSSIPVLDEAVRLLNEYPSIRIEVAGHTDSQGDRDHNMQLSSERADSVRSYLVGMGIAEDRITTVGFGPDVPVDSNDTKQGRSNNRRIEFRVRSASAGD